MKLKHKIRLLLADDHPVARRGIASLLSQCDQFEIAGEAVNGRDALQKARELHPDIILMDIEMPQMCGLTATELIRKEQPDAKVIILSVHSQTDHTLRVVRSGACGYLLKTASPQELLEAIMKVANGEVAFSPEVARLALNQFVRASAGNEHGKDLTPRETEVLITIAEGLSNKEIAMRLNVGVRTVETHRERIIRKLNIHSIAGLTKFAITKGWVSLPHVQEMSA